MARQKPASTRTAHIAFRGGLNMVTPPLTTPDGYLLDSLNFMPALDDGYARIAGYCRHDGQTEPWKRLGAGFLVDDVSHLAVGQTVVFDGDPDLTAVIVMINAKERQIITAQPSGHLSDPDTMAVDGHTIEIESTEYPFGASLPEQKVALETYYRKRIQQPPGQGETLGVTFGLGNLLAFRGQGDRVVCSKATPDSWVEIPCRSYLCYRQSGRPPLAGEVLSINGVDVPVVAAQVFNGSKDDSSVTGYCVFDAGAVTDSFYDLPDGSGITVSGAEAGVLDGNPQKFCIPATGSVFEFVEHNFYGGAHSRRVYGVSGTAPAFEIDETGISPILVSSNNQDNTPQHLTTHKEHLFLAYSGGIVRHSVVGEPWNFNGALGAFELGAGDEVTEMKTVAGGVLLIACRNKLQVLYGNTVADWRLQLLSGTTGALPKTTQTLQVTTALDDAGIVELGRVEAFGDFEQATTSRLIQPLLNEYKNAVIGTALNRDFNQIRYYFKNGMVLAYKPQHQAPPSITRLSFPVEPTCVCHGETEEGNPVMFFGTKDGWVYQDNVGCNFDGEAVPAFFQTSYSHLGTPAVRKSFKRVELDFSGEYGTIVHIAAEIDYSEGYVPTIKTTTLPITGGGGMWDMSNWNEFYWSSNTVNSGGIEVTGTGRNISILVTGEHVWQDPYTIYGAYVHYIPRRLHRG